MEELESQVVHFLKLLIMLATAAIVAVMVWWKFNPLDDEPKTPVSPVVIETPAVAEPQSPPEVELIAPPKTEVILSEPDLVSVQESDVQEQESVLQIIEEPPAPTPEKKGALTLSNSDPAVKKEIRSLSAKTLKLVANEHVLRKFVRAVNALEDGTLVAQYRPLVEPQTPFLAKKIAEDEWLMDDKNFARYEPYIAAAESLGAEGIVGLYQEFSPLLEEAFRELGVDKPSFDTTFKNTLIALLSTPELEQQLILVQPSVMYKYKSKHIEGLSAPRKLMLRIGPENRKRVKRLSRELLDQLP